jgi:hypothetical protein
MISNADTGVVLSWSIIWEGDNTPQDPQYGMAITTGTSLSSISRPAVSNHASVVPVLQAEDGSFIGTSYDGDTGQSSMIAFDASGNLRWSVPNYVPLIATVDGGVIGVYSSYAGPISQAGPAVQFDQNGNATGQLPNLLIPSWRSNTYQIGSTDQVLNPILIAATWSALAVGTEALGIAWQAAHFRIDSKTNLKVKNILTPARWKRFANSHCGSVLGNSQGMTAMIPNYSLQVVQTKQGLTNFYSVDNPGVGDLPLREVTGGQYGTNETLANYLRSGGATAATANMGYSRQTAVVFQANFFSQQYPEFDLVHEILFHAYAGLPDDAIFGNAYFTTQGLWRPAGSSATINISTWMSTDCTCTPGKPGTTCQANTAKW